MKSAVSILLLCTLLCPFCMHLVQQSHAKKALRREVKQRIIEGIDLEELVQLSFSKQDLNKQIEWEHEHEFKFRGNYYDVVKKEEKKDSLHFWLWLDRKETELNKRLFEKTLLAWQSNPDRKESDSRLEQFGKTLFFCDSEPQNLKSSSNNKNRFSLPDQINHESIAQKVELPPPIQLLYV